MIYAGYHIVLQDGRYSVYEREDPQHGYLGRSGTFNTAGHAKRWIQHLRKVKS